MKIAFVYPAFERHAEAHPELKEFVPANEYIGPPSLGIASVAACTPAGHEIVFHDDRVERLDPDKLDADLYALSFFTPAATRAMEIGDELRARGKKVVMGGIFPSMMPDEVAKHCDAHVVGEGEEVWPQIVADAEAGTLKKRYQANGEMKELSEYPPPRVDLYLDAETDTHKPDDYPLQISRGCPLRCDACVLPEYLGRKVRFMGDDNLVATMKTFTEAGKLMSLTEDISVTFANGARRHLRRFLEMVIGIQQEGIPIRLSYLGISMPMILTLPDDLFELLGRTGIDRFYLVGGFDPITRKAFGQGDPAAMAKAERVIERSHDMGIKPYISFLMGNETDDDGVFDRMLEFSFKTKLDLAEFCISTPYPGTPIWRRYQEEGRLLGRDWKYYNDANVTFRPHQMSVERLEEGYLHVWREFYRGRDQELGNREHLHRTIQF